MSGEGDGQCSPRNNSISKLNSAPSFDLIVSISLPTCDTRKLNWELVRSFVCAYAVNKTLTWHVRCSSGIRNRSSPNLDGASGYWCRVYDCNACNAFSWHARTFSGSRKSDVSVGKEITYRARWIPYISKWQLMYLPDCSKTITFIATYSYLSTRSRRRWSVKLSILSMHGWKWGKYSIELYVARYCYWYE